MKMFKRISALILSVLMLMSFAFCFVSAEDNVKENINFVVIGDSIAEGFGVANEDDAAYGRIVADTNGYNYVNYAAVANDTKDLLYKLENRSDIIKSIEEADIINLCIGSNNYLANDDVVLITAGAIFGVNDKQLDEIAEDMFKDYLVIYDTIRELNPDAVLIIDNIYCAWRGLGHIPFIKAVNRINANINKLCEGHDDIIIFDTNSVITHNTELIADDCVHPNAKGNVELARHFLQLLKENGLGENTDPVILTPGIDYNFYQENFGKLFGTIIQYIVKVLTLNF